MNKGENVCENYICFLFTSSRLRHKEKVGIFFPFKIWNSVFAGLYMVLQFEELFNGKQHLYKEEHLSHQRHKTQEAVSMVLNYMEWLHGNV